MGSHAEEKSPIERAMEKARFSEIECYLKAGVDPNYRDSKDNTLLYTAVKNNYPDIIRLLLKYNANVNQLNMGRESVIHLAARLGNVEICKLLLTLGASLSIENIRNQLPIITAIKADHQEIVSLFLHYSPEMLLVKDNAGKEIWEYASTEKMKTCISGIKQFQKLIPLLFVKVCTKTFEKIPDGVFQSLGQFL